MGWVFNKSKLFENPEAPFRAEVLSKEALAQRAVELAEVYTIIKEGGRGVRLQSRFRENTRVLNTAYFAFSAADKNKEVLTAGAEWLLDNYHVIDEQVRDIRRDLPRGYYRALPKLATGELFGVPRAYQLACDFIAHTDSVIDSEALAVFIHAFQTKCFLKIGEIWAVPIMLRLALVENLRRLAQASLIARGHRLAAEEFCAETIDDPHLAGTQMLLSLVRRYEQDPDVLEYGAAHILRRLRARGAPAALSLQWFDEKVRERGLDPNDLARRERQAQAADQISVGNSVTALKSIGSSDWREWFEQVSTVDQVLLNDPAGVYAKSDFTTRDLFRHEIEQLARRAKRPEVEIAKETLKLAEEGLAGKTVDALTDIRVCHVGYYLIDSGLAALEQKLGLSATLKLAISRSAKRFAFLLYSGLIAVLTFCALLALAFYSHKHAAPLWWYFASSVLLLLPASELAILITQWLVTKLVAPQPLPKLDYEKGIDPNSRTIVTVQTIIASQEGLERSIEALEIRAIANQDPNLYFALLADLPDAGTEVQSGDRGVIRLAQLHIDNLNQRYCAPGESRFFVLIRRRLWNEEEGQWMAWERKRGKITEFNRLIRGATDTTFCLVHGGSVEQLSKVRYVITLDSDTQLPAQTAGKLIGAIAHPLNRPVHDAKSGKVIKGYAVIQPRVGISLKSGSASRFARIFSGHSGLDPYTRTVSDVYQDAFGEGSYIGKGIYAVDSFERALHNRVPDNALLSHDLFEGLFARVGLASDVELFDEFPMRYHANAKRQQRWIRGDWQLVPWIGRKIPCASGVPTRSDISALGQWKLIDNLRRSLLPISFVLALLLIWSFAPGSQWYWHGALALVICFPIYMSVVNTVLGLQLGYSASSYLYGLWEDIWKGLQHAFLQLSFMAHQAWISERAISTTLYRVYRSRRRLLEWETADAAERRLGGDLASFSASMLPSMLVMMALVASFSLAPSFNYYFALPIVGLWLLAPIIAWRVSQRVSYKPKPLGRSARVYMREVAYDTWRYFDTFLKPEYNYLIPDNLQVVPEQVVAERTSPTNISLSLLSVVSAYDLGFVPLPGSIFRLRKIFDTLKRLERFHGHFLNWYEIRQLRALPPRYVSMVDSGNLLGHLVALREGIAKFDLLPLVSFAHVQHVLTLVEGYEGLPPEALQVLRGLKSGPRNLKDLIAFVKAANQLKEVLTNKGASEDTLRALREYDALSSVLGWAEFLPVLKDLGERQALHSKLKNVDRILVGRSPSLSLLRKLTRRLSSLKFFISSLAQLDQADRQVLDSFFSVAGTAHEILVQETTTLQSLMQDSSNLINELDFKFLIDNKKKLFTIGYNVENGRKDSSYYDLMASEARLGSFVAIAKGDLPQAHWFMLNRALTEASGGKALLSWSATMFEYLMPLLVMADFPGTLLSETYRTVVATQQIYARRRGTPWGISESAYSGVDFQKTYQYRAFGIPGLGLKRGLGDDLVISPYSTMLALSIDPAGCYENLKLLEREGARGDFGFYEALDYTRSRLSSDERKHIVKSFLAHHQGMSLVAINNLLNDGIFQRRFHSSPMVRSSELLLQERFPRKIPIIVPHQAELSRRERGLDEVSADRSEVIHTPHTVYPRTHVVANDDLTLIVDNGGASAALYKHEIALNRFQADGVLDNSGTFIYVRDVESGKIWSNTYQPTRVEPDLYEVVFSPDKVEFKRRDYGITISTEVTADPEENVEIRRLTLTNASPEARMLELTSFAEVALAPRRADWAHPAFSKMFVESEFVDDQECLLFSRRPRHEGETPLFMMHLVNMPVVWSPLQYETSRQKFIGRGGSVARPLALQNNLPLSGTVGTVLDPVLALRVKIEVKPSESHTVCFVTGIAASREEVLDLAAKYRDSRRITRSFEMAWSHSDVDLRNQQFSIAQTRTFQLLANAMIYNVDVTRAATDIIRKNRLSQSALWRFGISGDEPIVLVVLNDPEQTKLAQETLLAHEYLRVRGFVFDLVILNEFPGGYLQNLQEELDFMIKSGYSRDCVDRRGGVFLRNRTQLSEEEVNLLQSVARVAVYGNRGSLAQQLNFARKLDLPVARPESSAKKTPGSFKPASEPLVFFNGIGGFTPDGKSYVMNVSGQNLPPQPWSNVIANREFGFLVTESGAGFSWSDNSHENRLTPWSNDPVSDPFSEVLYIRDRDSGDYWCPTPRPVDHGEVVRVQHAIGYSSFSTQVQQIYSKLTLAVDVSEKVKYWHLDLVNGDAKARNLELYLYVDWLLGVTPAEHGRYLHSAYDVESQLIYAQNPFNIDFSNQLVFVGASHVVHSYTSNRREFIGHHSDLSRPMALERARLAGIKRAQILANPKDRPLKLSGAVGGGLDNCAVLKVQIALAPREKQQLVFFMGQTGDLAQARAVATRYRAQRNWSRSFDEVTRFWSDVTETIQVNTPDRKFDLLVNGWLLYQTLSGRLMARSGFYQSSGALGFRDQLQDSLALVWSRPDDLKRQILLNASRQFPEGDVQHWWHPPSGRGIRTRISDNYLWLPFAVERYLSVTADTALLDEQAAFIEGPLLQDGEMDKYFTPRVSERKATIFEHCMLALDRALKVGPHGLALIGGGDWNDGMNSVGPAGQGESVWLSWFLATTLTRFSALVEARGSPDKARSYREFAQTLVCSIDSQAWDGEWYRRAYFDDGTPIGSATAQECRIDSIAQSWSVINGQGDRAHQQQALDALLNHLYRPDEKLVLLLTPPFNHSQPSPGYIQGYPPGLRENGGQYTHAAAWAVLALALAGRGSLAHKVFDTINPISHSATLQDAWRYQTEPYVTCGDVYSVGPLSGRGGWSWYTGSSSWLYQVAVENILGIKQRGQMLEIDPCIPSKWKEFRIRIKRSGLIINVRVLNPFGVERGVKSVVLNGNELPDKRINCGQLISEAEVVVNMDQA